MIAWLVLLSACAPPFDDAGDSGAAAVDATGSWCDAVRLTAVAGSTLTLSAERDLDFDLGSAHSASCTPALIDDPEGLWACPPLPDCAGFECTVGRTGREIVLRAQFFDVDGITLADRTCTVRFDVQAEGAVLHAPDREFRVPAHAEVVLDLELDAGTPTLADGPQAADVVLNADGTVDLVMADVDDAFTYRVTDDAGGRSPLGTVTLRVDGTIAGPSIVGFPPVHVLEDVVAPGAVAHTWDLRDIGTALPPTTRFELTEHDGGFGMDGPDILEFRLPHAHFVGSRAATVAVTVPGDPPVSSRVMLTVDPVDDPPEGDALIAPAVHVGDTIEVSAGALLAAWSDPDGDALQLVPDPGAPPALADVAWTDAGLSIRGTAVGDEAFGVQVSDGVLDVPTTLALTVTGAVDDACPATWNGEAFCTCDLVANDRDLAGPPVICDPGGFDELVFVDGRACFGPASSGDRFTYSDDCGLASAAVVVDWDPAPVTVCADDHYDLGPALELVASWEDGVLANDAPAPLTAALVVLPDAGEVSLSPDGGFLYRVPSDGGRGATSFLYRCTSALGDGVAATATVTWSTDDWPLGPCGPTSFVTDEDEDVVVDDYTACAAASGAAVAVLVAPTRGVLTYGDAPDEPDTLVYDPAEDATGRDTAIVRLTRDDDVVDVELEFWMTPVDDTIAHRRDLAFVTPEDERLVVPPDLGLFTDGPVDVDGERWTPSVDLPPSHGVVAVDVDGGFTYVPDLDFAGEDGFTVFGTDGHESVRGRVSVTVDPVEDAPRTLPDVWATAFEVPLDADPARSVLANDHDPEGGALTAHLVAPTANGTLALEPDGTFTFEPDPGFVGLDSFTYVARDGGGLDSDATPVHLSVAGELAELRAIDHAYETDEDVPLEVAAPGLRGDDAGPLVAVLDTPPALGTVRLSADGAFVYTPARDADGIDAFTYTLSDGIRASDPATVTVDVRRLNDPPVARDDAHRLTEDVLHEVRDGVLANDDDVDLADPDVPGDLDDRFELYAELEEPPRHAETFELAVDGTFTYRAVADFHGVDDFTYRAVDLSGAASEVARVTLTVEPANDPPTAGDGARYGLDEDSSLAVDAPGVLADADDIDGDALYAVVERAPAHGVVLLSLDGSFVYMPSDHFFGEDSFEFVASDGAALSAPATVVFEVAAVDDSPQALEDTYDVPADAPFVVGAILGVLANDSDPDGDDLTVSVARSPDHGVLELTPDGGFTYTPDPGFRGYDGFVYDVTDGLTEAEGTVVLQVGG